MREWVKLIKLPFSVELHIPPPTPKPTYIFIEEAEELRATIAMLTK